MKLYYNDLCKYIGIKNIIVHLRQTTAASLLRKRKQIKENYMYDVWNLVWRVNGLQECKEKQ